MADSNNNQIIKELRVELFRMVDLFENTRINYQLIDAHANIVDVNKSWLENLGYKKDDVIGKPFGDFLSTESTSKFNKYLLNFIKDDFKKELELTLCCSDGSEIIANYSCFGNKDEKGRLLNIHCVFENITKLRKTEEALKISEDNYERIFNSFVDVYYQTDKNSILTLISPAARKMGGYEPDELVGRSVGDFMFSEEERAKFRELLFKQGYVDDYDLKLRKKDGSLIDISLNAHLMKDKQGEIIGIEGVIRDISRRKEYEKNLEESQSLYKTLAENYPDVIMRFDRSFCHLFVNSRVEDYVDIKASDFIGKSHRELNFLPRMCKFWEEALRKVFTSGKKQIFEFRLEQKDKVVDFEWILVPEFSQGNKADTVLAISRDITERKKFENEIATYNNRLQQITEFVPAILFQLRQKGEKINIIYISQNAEKRLGVEVNSIINDPRSILKSVSNDDRKRIENELKSALKEKRVAEIEYEIRSKNGKRRWSRTKFSPRKIDESETIWTGISIDVTEETIMKRKVREQEDHLKTLFEFANVGIATMSLKGVVTAVNPAVCKITGFSEDEIVGKHFKEISIFYKTDLPFYLKIFADAVVGKMPEEKIVFEWRNKKGENRWAESYLNLIKDKGIIKGFQGVFMDVTHQKLLQQVEKNKQKDIEFLFDSAVGLLKIDSEQELFQFITQQMMKLVPGTIINVNSINVENTALRVEAVEGISGKVKKMILRLFNQQLVGRAFRVDKSTFDYAKHGKLLKYNESLFDLTLQQIPKGICRQIEKLIQLNEIYELSIGVGEDLMGGCVIFLRKDQTIENHSLIETLFRQATEALSRLRTHNRLTRNEELYRSLAENAQDLILRVDNKIKAIYANQAFLKTFEFNINEIRDKDLKNLGIPPKICDLIESTINYTIKTGKPQTCDNVINLDNELNFFEWRMFPEYDESNHLQSVLVFIRNTTSRKEIEAKIQDSIVNKNKIYSLISHDLRNPFNSILGFLELLKKDFNQMSDELRLKYIDVAFESSQNLYILLNSLQEWSQGFEQDHNINPIFFDPFQLMNSSLEIFKPQILEKKLIINNNIPTGVIVKADYNMVYTSFRNIISNACKFSQIGGKIDISLRKRKDEVVIEISDYGIGMSEEEIQKLFNLEERFAKSGTLGEKGSGLGLLLTKELIELNGGTLKLFSRPDKGCAATIILKT